MDGKRREGGKKDLWSVLASHDGMWAIQIIPRGITWRVNFYPLDRSGVRIRGQMYTLRILSDVSPRKLMRLFINTLGCGGVSIVELCNRELISSKHLRKECDDEDVISGGFRDC